MNVEIGTEVALFPEKEYINGIFFAVWNKNTPILIPLLPSLLLHIEKKDQERVRE